MKSRTERAALNRSAAFASIAVALVLIGLKVWAAWSTGSTAMLGSLADTALDLVASLATLTGVWIAAMPRDANHRFGHDKAEALAAIVQVVLISIAALSLAVHSIEQGLAGTRTQAAGEGIAVSVAAIVLTLALLGWQWHVIRATRSLAIATDHVHYQSDLALNVAVIAALALDQYGGVTGSDALFGLAIALWLGWNGWRASHDAVEQLMDKGVAAGEGGPLPRGPRPPSRTARRSRPAHPFRRPPRFRAVPRRGERRDEPARGAPGDGRDRGAFGGRIS